MKKTTLILGIAMMSTIASVTLISCENNQEATGNHDHEAHTVYQCPMDCEEGKTYVEPGTCPTCKMDLVEVE